MLQAVVEHLTTDFSHHPLVHQFVQPPGMCILSAAPVVAVSSEADSDATAPTESASWQFELDMLRPASMAELYEQLQKIVSASEANGQSVKFAAVVLFSDRVFLAGYGYGLQLLRGGHEKMLLSAQKDLQVLEGNYREGDQYQVDGVVHVSFLDLATTSSGPRQVQAGLSQVMGKAKSAGELASIVKNSVGMLVMHNAGWILEWWRGLSRQRKIQIVVVFLVVASALTGGIVWQKWQQQQAVQEAEAVVTPIHAKLLDVQRLERENPLQAQTASQELLTEIDTLNQEPKYRSSTKELLAAERVKVVEFQKSLSSLALPALPTFFDLRLLQSDLLGNRIVIADKTVLVLDSQPKKVVSIDINTKNAKFIPTGDLASVADFVASKSTLYYLGDGVSQASLQNDEAPKKINLSQDKFTGELLRYYNENLYTLDRTQRSVSRITLANQNDKKQFAVASWMKSGQFVDYDVITSMAVDGDVWFGTKTGQIQKFTTGKSVDFVLSNLPLLPNSPVSIYTDEDSKNLYILEPLQNRLIIADKNGVVLREITSSTFASSTALVASETAGKVFVLSGSLIFEVNL